MRGAFLIVDIQNDNFEGCKMSLKGVELLFIIVLFRHLVNIIQV